MKISLLLIAMAVPTVACLDGCSRRPNNPSAALVGQYRLHWGNGSNCSERGIEDSTLELRADGTSEQRDRFKDGSQFVTKGNWEYDGKDGVLLDKLRATNTLEIDKGATSTTPTIANTTWLRRNSQSSEYRQPSCRLPLKIAMHTWVNRSNKEERV